MPLLILGGMVGVLAASTIDWFILGRSKAKEKPRGVQVAGVSLQRQELVDRGVEVLQWLSKVQTTEKGHMSFIGNDGWMRKSGEHAQYDQQPLEAAAFIGACKAAYRATEVVALLGVQIRTSNIINYGSLTRISCGHHGD